MVTFLFGGAPLEAEVLEVRARWTGVVPEALDTPVRGFEPFARSGWNLQFGALDGALVGWDRGPDARPEALVVRFADDELALVSDLLIVDLGEEMTSEEAENRLREQGWQLAEDSVRLSRHFRARRRTGVSAFEQLAELPAAWSAEPDMLQVLRAEPLRKTAATTSDGLWFWKEPKVVAGGCSIEALHHKGGSGNGLSGNGLCIAVLDEGFKVAHETFSTTNRRVDTARFSLSGWIANTLDFTADREHGTACAGAAAGAETKKYRGVAHRADLLLLQIADFELSGNGSQVNSLATLAKALEYALDPSAGGQRVDAPKGAHVVSGSLGGAKVWKIPQALLDAVASFENRGRRGAHGTPVVWAVSNADTASTRDHLVRLDGVWGISGANRQGARLAAATGPHLDFLAPGVDVLCPDLGSYGHFSGTSIATPLVAGILALLLEIDPSRTRKDLYEALKASARTCVRDDFRGWGNVDGLAASKFPSCP